MESDEGKDPDAQRLGKKDKAEARIKPSTHRGESKGKGQRPGSSTDGKNGAKAGEGKGREGKESESSLLKESSEGMGKDSSSSGATGKGQEAGETILIKVWEQANSPTPDHTGKGGMKRARARTDFRSEFEDKGKSPKCTRATS